MLHDQVLDTGGTLVDALTLTAYAALNNARCVCAACGAAGSPRPLMGASSYTRSRLPKLHVISVGVRDGGAGADDMDASMDADDGAGTTAEKEFDVEVDDDPSHAVAIDASQVPVCVTFAQVGGRSVVDARQNEELCASSRMMVFVNRAGNICAVETSGTGSISTASLHQSLAVRSCACVISVYQRLTSRLAALRTSRPSGRGEYRRALDSTGRCGSGGRLVEASHIRRGRRCARR